MTAENFDRALNALADRQPFRIFTVELMTGERIEIDHARAITNRNGRAVFLAPGGRIQFFDHESVHQFIDASSHELAGPQV